MRKSESRRVRNCCRSAAPTTAGEIRHSSTRTSPTRRRCPDESRIPICFCTTPSMSPRWRKMSTERRYLGLGVDRDHLTARQIDAVRTTGRGTEGLGQPDETGHSRPEKQSEDVTQRGVRKAAGDPHHIELPRARRTGQETRRRPGQRPASLGEPTTT